MSEGPSWVKRPPWWAWILIIGTPVLVCCGGPVLVLMLGAFQGIQDLAGGGSDRTFTKEEIQVDDSGSVTASKEKKGEHFIEEPKLELGEWTLDTKKNVIRGTAKNLGTVAITLRLKAYYHDAEGSRIGEEDIYSVTLIPGVTIPVRLPSATGGVSPPPGATEKIEMEVVRITQDRLGVLTEEEEAVKDGASFLITDVLEPNSDEQIPVMIQVKNTGDKSLIAFRVMLHFEDGSGNEVAAWQIDVGRHGIRSERGDDWFWTRPLRSALKPGYLKEGEIRFDHGGPDGWAKTKESIRAEVLGVFQVKGKGSSS